MKILITPKLGLNPLHKSALDFAKQTSQKSLNTVTKDIVLHTYIDEKGLPIYWKIRIKIPDTNKKWIRAFSQSGSGFQLKEPDFKVVYPIGNGKKPLYRLRELVTAPTDSIVFVVEGEQKADALAKLGLIATTSGSAGSVHSTYWQSIATGCTVRIWRDNDDAGTKYQDEVKAVLKSLGFIVSCVDVDVLDLPSKGDAVDWLAMRTASNLTTTAADVLALACVDAELSVEVVGGLDSEVTDHIDFEVVLTRLASLSFLDYERCRNSEAKRLGIRPTVLDKLIKQYKDSGDERMTSDFDMFPVIEPWGDPVNGAALLDQIVEIVNCYIVCEKPTTHAVALWIMFSWCIDVMHVSPIACITAPEKRCGKTQLLNLIGMLCMKPLPAANITAAALFRSIEAFKPTLLIDEADSFLKDNEELRGIINSGHTRQSAFVIRTVGENFEPTHFSTWGAKAISGIGHLSDTLKDRSILLELRRKQPNEQRQRLRHADMRQFEQVKRKLARWAEDNMEALRVARPELPDTLNDRAQDNWESLLAIADCVGGHWVATARHAAMSISGIEEDAPSINEELLIDIKQAFHQKQTTRLSSTDLLECLWSDDEAPWATWTKGKPITARQLGRRLSEFNISSKPIRGLHGSVYRGYELVDFEDAFTRYIQTQSPKSAIPSVTALQPSISKAQRKIPSVTNSVKVTNARQSKPLHHKTCNSVASKATVQPDTENTDDEPENKWAACL